jgi:hypothetical protein
MSPPGFTVHSGKDKPAEAFVAVPYEGLWFWIDRRDLSSKTTSPPLPFVQLPGGGAKRSCVNIPTS